MSAEVTEVARTLRERRRGLGLTRSRLAEQTGMSVADLTRWERGESMPTATQVVALAEAVGLDERETREWLDASVVVDLTGPEVAVELLENPGPPSDPFLRRAALLRTQDEPGVFGRVAARVGSLRPGSGSAAPASRNQLEPAHGDGARPAPSTATGLVREPQFAARPLPSVFPDVPVSTYDPATVVYSTAPVIHPTPGEEHLYLLRRVRTAGALIGLGLVLWWAIGALGEGLGDVIELFRSPAGG